MIRVLITDDSPTLRMVVRSLLEGDPEIEVVGEAQNGKEAILKCRHLDPDIVTMDIRMPVMNGFEAISRIMAESPRPIVVLTSPQSDVELGITFRAIQAGGLMVIGKPSDLLVPGDKRKHFIDLIKAMAGVKVVGRRNVALNDLPGKPGGMHHPERIRDAKVVVIGASTGGPPALQAILKKLPIDFPLPVAVVQHISVGFITGLARWLDSNIPMRTRVAINGSPLASGTVYLAPDDRHMTIDQYRRIRCEKSTKIDGHRPSATRLFDSVARNFGSSAIGVLLTGMGGDGARGLKMIRDAGGYTIAQDRDTSIVFGMPKVAIDLGAVDAVLPLDDIAVRLVEKIKVAESQVAVKS